MNATELNSNLLELKEHIRNIVEEYVKSNAKYKIGNVVQSSITTKGYFVITQIGYQLNHGIVYYGKKLRTSDGEITNFEMHSGIGTREMSISKATLKLKNDIEVSHIDNYKYFNNKIEIKFNV